MVATSIISRTSESLDVFTRRSQPKIEINLQGQTPGLVNSYTSGDQIQGTATITVEQNTYFDEVDIVLQGTSHTTVERATCPGHTRSQQMFLKLRQPIEETAYPTPRLLEPGRSYTFPFTFVIPEQLLPQVCTHTRSNHQIHRFHTMLPPTLGDPMLAGNGKTLLDDMAPYMSRISYMIRTAVVKRSWADHRQVKVLANFAKKVRIIPTVEEEPPINTVDHPYYCTRKEKSVKRGFLRGKLGQLVASSSQPKPIRLSPPNCESHDTISTVTTVQLRFDPVGKEQPPQLGSMASKLKVSTFYSVTPWQDFPCQSSTMPFSQAGRALFTESVPLSTMCVASAQWQKHSVRSDTNLCDSLNSSSISLEDSTGPSASFSGDTYYTASVVIPITLPKSKAFVPTFHSCLMSRTYSLDLSLTYHTPGTNVLTPTVHLRLPIQITTQPKYDSLKSAIEGVIVTQEEVNAFFQPRSVAPPMNEAVIVAPPEYSEIIASTVPRMQAAM